MRIGTKVILFFLIISFLQIYIYAKYVEIYPSLIYPAFSRIDWKPLKKDIEGYHHYIFNYTSYNNSDLSFENSKIKTVYINPKEHSISLINYKIPIQWNMNPYFEITLADETKLKFTSNQVFSNLNVPELARSQRIMFRKFYNFPSNKKFSNTVYSRYDINEIVVFLFERIHQLLKWKGFDHEISQIDVVWEYIDNKELVKRISISS